mmetsp:Transcript_5032/g.17927  ORF Transcript_5032/g.17927 Transcript_5032/m.17927 type:complete len:230 (-) Transcript_5032:101-790(-)
MTTTAQPTLLSEVSRHWRRASTLRRRRAATRGASLLWTCALGGRSWRLWACGTTACTSGTTRGSERTVGRRPRRATRCAGRRCTRSATTSQSSSGAACESTMCCWVGCSSIPRWRCKTVAPRSSLRTADTSSQSQQTRRSSSSAPRSRRRLVRRLRRPPTRRTVQLSQTSGPSRASCAGSLYRATSASSTRWPGRTTTASLCRPRRTVQSTAGTRPRGGGETRRRCPTR